MKRLFQFFRLTEAGQSGIITDSLGRKYKMVNGKRVPMDNQPSGGGKAQGGKITDYLGRFEKGGKGTDAIQGAAEVQKVARHDPETKKAVAGALKASRQAIKSGDKNAHLAATKAHMAAYKRLGELWEQRYKGSNSDYAGLIEKGMKSHKLAAQQHAQHIGSPGEAS